MTDNHQITTVEELRKVIVHNKPEYQKKQDQSLIDRLYDYIDEYAQGFVSKSPMVFLGTANDVGHVDVTPRGDAPGFVEIQDKKTLLLPERQGNTDARSLRNILKNDQVSLLFVIPGVKDVLRITGKAALTRDPVLLLRMESCGKPAKICIVISVKECFFHCGRAFNRSHLWKPDKWLKDVPSYSHMRLSKQIKTTTEEVEKMSDDVIESMGEGDGAY